MTIDLTAVRQLAEQSARLVGERIRSTQAETLSSIEEKGRDDLVTEVDLWSERTITEAILKEFPDHTVIGEETQAQLAKDRGQSLEEISALGPCWILDPLDGTANFVSGLPHSCVSIAFLEDGKQVFGQIYDPFLNELFTATVGEGAYLNGKKITCRERAKLQESVILTGFSSNRFENWKLYREVNVALIDHCHKCRIYGAAALDICWVAAARADVFFQYSLRCWDLAAATLIAKEAGASVNCILEPERENPLFAASTLVCGPGLEGEAMQVISDADSRGREHS